MDYNSFPKSCVSSHRAGRRSRRRLRFAPMRTSTSVMPRRVLLVLLVLALAACSKGPDSAQKASSTAAPLLISPEDVHTVRNSVLTSGPAITGSVQPERKADLRAEVQAIVLKVLKEN